MNDNNLTFSYLTTRDEIRVEQGELAAALCILYELEDRYIDTAETLEHMLQIREAHGACQNKAQSLEYLKRKCFEQQEVCRQLALPQYDPTYDHHQNGFRDIIKLLES